jgi:hypothetical protein
MNLFEVVEEIGRWLMSIFLRDRNSQRPVYGGTSKFQTDPHLKDLIVFYEYFHGDNRAGIGASHLTLWTSTIALLAQMFPIYSKTEIDTKDASQLENSIRARHVDESAVKSGPAYRKPGHEWSETARAVV